MEVALLGGTKELKVPLFQRTYTRKDRDHSQLWSDILAEYEMSKSRTYTGDLSTKNRPADANLTAQNQ